MYGRAIPKFNIFTNITQTIQYKSNIFDLTKNSIAWKLLVT